MNLVSDLSDITDEEEFFKIAFEKFTFSRSDMKKYEKIAMEKHSVSNSNIKEKAKKVIKDKDSLISSGNISPEK